MRARCQSGRLASAPQLIIAISLALSRQVAYSDNVRKQRSLPDSLAKQAYSKILDKILKGEYPLGAALSRRKLGVEFGMSFLPISEAIKRLEQEGLVESRPRVGTRVRIPTAQDLRDRHIMREALETHSARLFAEKASADERAEVCAMASHLDTMTDRCASGDADRDFAFRTQMCHLSFHMRIAECSGCAALCESLQQNQVLIFNWLYDVATDHRMPPQWHGQLADAIVTGNPDTAEAAMRSHIRYGIEDIQAEIVRRFGTLTSGFGRIQRSRASVVTTGAWRTKTSVAH
jgi:DNA-binding GntR family transcriptional regulator